METVNTFIDQLLGLPFTVGLIFIIVGLIQLLIPPKKINSFYGYRTPRSMQSQPQWDFAQVYSSKKMMLGGVVLILLSMVKLVCKMNVSTQMTVSFILLAIVVAGLFISTEKAIKNKFPKSE